jgi:hypothetical protein
LEMPRRAREYPKATSCPPERHRGQESRHIAQAVPGACCHAGGSSNPEAFEKGPQALEGIAAGRTDAASATRKALSGLSRRRCGASSTLLCEVHLAAPSKSACDLSRQLVSTLLFFQKIEDSVDYIIKMFCRLALLHPVVLVPPPPRCTPRLLR